MSSLSSLYIKKETIETLLKIINTKGEKGVELTISINDGTNSYGQNVSSWVSQSKEQREAKKTRFFAGNGKVFWTDGKISLAKDNIETVEAEEVPNNEQQQNTTDDLPF